MLFLEDAILEEAMQQWLEAGAAWDLQNATEKFRLRCVIGELFYKSLQEVAESFAGTAVVSGSLDTYADTFLPVEALLDLLRHP
jgi:hypothetical protein